MGSCKLPIDCSWLETLLLPVHFCGSELFPTSCGFKNADAFCRREKAFQGKPKGKLFWLAQLCLHSNACSCLSQNAEQGSGSELRRNVTVSLPDHEMGAPPLFSVFLPVTLSENALKVSEAAAWGVGARGGDVEDAAPSCPGGGRFPCCWRQCGHHTGGTKGRSPYAFGALMLIGPTPVGSPRSLSKWRKLGDPQAFASYCPGWKILILCPRRKISERPSDIKS